MEQRIRFCTAPDGVKLAYATSGKGPALVRAPHWLTHLEFDWRTPVHRPTLEGLSKTHTLVRFDPRGCGLSERGEITFEAWLGDLETVVDAAGLESFVLYGASQGGPIAVAYAMRHPERVAKLVLHGAYARGRLVRASRPQDEEEAQTFVHLARVGWGTDNAAFRRVFGTLFLPEATPEQAKWFDDLSRVSTDGETVARMLNMIHRIDVRSLAPQVKAPTLVTHARGDQRIPFEEGRLLASLIPNAQFVPLDTKNHILIPPDPAFAAFFAALREFLDVHERTEPAGGELTGREREILELIAQGLANNVISERLVISPNTLRNHITSIFDKLGAASRAEAIVRARDAGYGRN